MSKNLKESLLDEITRVNEIRLKYKDHPDLCENSDIRSELMEQDINDAKTCINSGDTIDMLAMQAKLKAWQI
jgi:hypothetical protein